MKLHHPFTVSVEGNIGSGKSTLLDYFSSFPGVITYKEPIDKWTNVGGHNLLHKLYEKPDRWNFLFQSYVQLTRLNIHLDSPSSSVKLMERSFHNNRFCFVENDYESGHLNEEEFQVLSEYFNFFEKHLDIGVDLIVYLKTSPEVAFERIKKRGRTEEAGIPIEYLQKVHDSYERWLVKEKPRPPPARVLTIDGNLNFDAMVEEYKKNKDLILGTCCLEESV